MFTFIFIAAVLLPLSFGNEQITSSKFYTMVVMDTVPPTFVEPSGVSTSSECAMRCNARLDDACTGFQFQSNHCVLFSDDMVGTDGNDGPSHRIGYRVKKRAAIPKCEHFAGFNLVSHKGRDYCLKAVRGNKMFELAKSDCQNKGASIMFVGDWNTYDVIRRLFKDDDPAPFIWMGSRSYNGGRSFTGVNPDNVLMKGNDLWNIGEPDTSIFDGCAVGQVGFGLRSKLCSDKASFACEIVEFTL